MYHHYSYHHHDCHHLRHRRCCRLMFVSHFRARTLYKYNESISAQTWIIYLIGCLLLLDIGP